MSEKLIGGVFNDPEPAPTLTELAAPVIAMAQAHCTYLDTMRQTDTADTNRAVLVAFKRALKEAEVPTPTAHDALIAEARRLAEILPLENMSAWGHKVTLIADALTAERDARVAAEKGRDDALSWTQTHANMDAYRKCLATAIARAEEAEKSALLGRDNWQDAVERMVEIEIERDALRNKIKELESFK